MQGMHMQHFCKADGQNLFCLADLAMGVPAVLCSTESNLPDTVLPLTSPDLESLRAATNTVMSSNEVWVIAQDLRSVFRAGCKTEGLVAYVLIPGWERHEDVGNLRPALMTIA